MSDRARRGGATVAVVIPIRDTVGAGASRLLMTVVLLGLVAGRRLRTCIGSAAPASPSSRAGSAAGAGAQGRAGGGRRPAPAAALDGARSRPRRGVLGLLRPRADDRGGVRGAVRPELPHPGHRELARARLHRGPLRVLCLAAVARVHRDPVRQAPREQGPVSGSSAPTSGAAWFVLFMIVNVVVDAAAHPGRPDQRPGGQRTHRLPALPAGRVRLPVDRPLFAPLGRTPTRCWRRSSCCSACRPARVHRLRHLQQAPAHPAVAAQRRAGPPAPRPRRAAAGLLRRQAGRLRWTTRARTT